MVKTVFSNGMRVSPQFLNSINNPQFVVDEGGEEFDGQNTRIRDDALSNDPTQIKGRFTAFEGELAVRAGTGLAVAYNSGRIALPSGIIATVPIGTLTGLPDNTTTFVFVDSDGTVQQSTQPPPIRFLMAQVQTSGGQVVSVIDLRERFKVMPVARAIAAFGSGGYLGDLNVTGTITLNGVHYYRNVTVQSTGVINVTLGFLWIKCSGSFTLNGTINVTPIISGGSGIQGLMPTGNYSDSGEKGQGIGGGGGHNAAVVPPYAYEAQAGLGSGGAAGGFNSNFTASGNQVGAARGGKGGGAFTLEAAGPVVINGAVLCDGGAGTAAGGTVAAGTGPIYLDGASGASGGSINIASLTSLNLTNLCDLRARGAAATAATRFNPTSPSPNQAGAGGGGGGWIILRSPNLVVNASASISVAGGAGGAGIPGDTSRPRGSTTGASFGGAGGGYGIPGSAGQPGNPGQIIQQNFAPI